MIRSPFLDKKSTLLPFSVEYLSKYIYLTCSLRFFSLKFRQNLHHLVFSVEFLSITCIYFLFMYYFIMPEQFLSFLLAHHQAFHRQNFHYLVFSVEFLSILCIYLLFYGHFPYVFRILDKFSTILMFRWKFCLINHNIMYFLYLLCMYFTYFRQKFHSSGIYTTFPLDKKYTRGLI